MSISSEATFSFHSLNSAVRKTILLQCLRMSAPIYQSFLYLNKPLRMTGETEGVKLPSAWSQAGKTELWQLCTLPQDQHPQLHWLFCLWYGRGGSTTLSSNILCKDRCFHLTQTLELGHYRMLCTRKITTSGYAWRTNWKTLVQHALPWLKPNWHKEQQHQNAEKENLSWACNWNKGMGVH